MAIAKNVIDVVNFMMFTMKMMIQKTSIHLFLQMQTSITNIILKK